MGSVAADITLSDDSATYTSATVYDSYTVDASARFNGDIDATAEADAKLTIITGTSNDTVTGSASSNFGDITTGTGNDTVVANGRLTSADTVSAGAGTDTQPFSNDASVEDADFTNVTGVKLLLLLLPALLSLTSPLAQRLRSWNYHC